MNKTNAIRLLENAGLAFQIHEYPVADGKIDAKSIAQKIGVPAEQVFKTLVTVANTGEHFVFVVPATCELDLKKAAKTAACKSIEMIPMKTLLPLTGYIHGGCSPVGMKKAFPTFVDETCQLYDTICVSGGQVGLNLELNAVELADFIGAKFADITVV